MSSQQMETSNPDPLSISMDSWARAEQATHEILCRIHPTSVAEQKRKEVIDYVQGLIRTRIGCEIFPYGSVPLKTYLPDGDIDLTAICNPNIENAMVSDVHAVLRGEEHNGAFQYEVKDVHSIDAEVKLVKCIVQNIVVDISFNQLGGLCTLCFLEQVDRLVGKDHLFKRSIILIKAWCYYESRILGAHHGLISTYALETLVLYIFHLFHDSLSGPLAVLYRFLDYFSKFDWENYCISLHGPVCKSSLPDTMAEVTENGGHDVLLSEEFLRNCKDMFSVPSRGSGPNLRGFPQKHLNIIDPLKENNNLGRSVNRGNFYRICSAFKYGARKLGWILLLPEEKIADELGKFFRNTLNRNSWSDSQNPAMSAFLGVSDHSSASSQSETCSEGKVFVESPVSFLDDNILGMEVTSSNRHALAEYCNGDVKEMVTPAILDITSSKNESSDCNLVTVLSENSYNARSCGFLGLLENGKTENGRPYWQISASSSLDNGQQFMPELDHVEKRLSRNMSCLYIDRDNTTSVSSATLSSIGHVAENVSNGVSKRSIDGIRSSEALRSLLDLTGDYDSYVRNLRYGQLCDGYATSPPLLLSPPLSPHLHSKNLWQSIRQSLPFKQNVNSTTNINGVSLGPHSYAVNHTAFPATGFDSEEKKRPQGIGTYFPNMNTRSYRDRPLPGRGKYQGPRTNNQLQRDGNNGNGLSTAQRDLNVVAEVSNELSETEFPVLGNGKSGSLDSRPSLLPKWVPYQTAQTNGLPHLYEKLEPGILTPPSSGVPFPEGNNGSDTCMSNWPAASDEEIPKQVAETNVERVIEQSYQLKNDEDFPPLSH